MKSDSQTHYFSERERLLGNCLKNSWRELAFALAGNEEQPEFSGIISLADPKLLPFLEKPGVFLIIGPEPSLPILHVGASQGPISGSLWARLEQTPGEGFVWRWEELSDPPPTFAACLTFERGWGLILSMKTLVVQQLGRDSEGQFFL